MSEVKILHWLENINNELIQFDLTETVLHGIIELTETDITTLT